MQHLLLGVGLTTRVGLVQFPCLDVGVAEVSFEGW
jgi:hypothetical protein